MPSVVKSIVLQLPPFVVPVAVFVNARESEIKRICHDTQIHTIQLHGDESPQFCKKLKGFKIIKAFRVSEGFDFSIAAQYPVDAFLFDTYQKDKYGGVGKKFNWKMLQNKKFNKPYILSGGLNVKNASQALSQLAVYALDVSSGVESSPGKKDPLKLKQFMRKAL